MKIIMYRWKAHQHKAIHESLLQAGHQVYEYSLPISNSEDDENYIEMLIAYLDREHFDFLFSINYFPVLSMACKEAGIPYVSWTCDSPLLAMRHNSVFNACNYIFVFDRSDYRTFQTLGAKHIYYLPLGASTSAVIPKKWEYSVSFVGNLYTKNEYDEILPSLSPYLSGYLDCALEAQLQISGGNLLYQLLNPEICEELEQISCYHKSEESFSTLRLLFANTVLGFKAASLERIRCLNRLSQLLIPMRGKLLSEEDGVHLFTDAPPDEWKELPAELPLVKLHGAVSYDTELPTVIGSSRINLNFTIPNIQTGLPLRIWDVMGAGGFLLSNEQDEISSLLKPGQDLECFASTEELMDKTLFYLKQEDARQTIARQGLKTVQQAHTVGHRTRKLLALLQENI